MRSLFVSLLAIVPLALQPAAADDISTTIGNFRSAGADDFIDTSYGCAVFPSIGRGKVFISRKRVGQTRENQITYVLQLGGQL